MYIYKVLLFKCRRHLCKVSMSFLCPFKSVNWSEIALRVWPNFCLLANNGKDVRSVRVQKVIYSGLK